MRKVLILLAFSVLVFTQCFGQAVLTPITGHLQQYDSSAQYKGTFVRFQLVYAGGQCRVPGVAVLADADQTFDVKPDTAGLVSKLLYGNDQIVCNGVGGNTRWRVTYYVNNQPTPACTLHITGTTPFNLDDAVCIETPPTVLPPTGDSTYLRLDGGNLPLHGDFDIGAYALTSGTLDTGVANGVLNVANARYGYIPGGDLGLALQTAYNSADCPALGCHLRIPAGSYTISTTFNENIKGKYGDIGGDGDGPLYISCAASANPCIQFDYATIPTGYTDYMGQGIGLKGVHLHGPSGSSNTTGLVVAASNGIVTGPMVADSAIENFHIGVDVQGGSFNFTCLQSFILGNDIGLNFDTLSENNRLYACNISNNGVGARLASGTVQFRDFGSSWDYNTTYAIEFAGTGGANVELYGSYFESRYCFIGQSGLTGSPALTIIGGIFTDLSSDGGNSPCPFIDSTNFTTLKVEDTSFFSLSRTYNLGIVKSSGTGTGVFLSLENNAPTLLTAECVGCTARYQSFQRSGATAVTPWVLGGISLGFREGANGQAKVGNDVVYADSGAHALESSYNNGAFFKMSQTIGTGTVTTPGTAVSAGACQAQTAITITGATTTDTATVALNVALPASWQTGIDFSHVSVTANTCTINLCNPTAGSITPTAQTLRCTVIR